MRKTWMIFFWGVLTHSTAFAQFTLQQLLEGEVKVIDLVRAEVTIDTLIEQALKDSGTRKSDLKKKPIKDLIAKLKVEEKELARKEKRLGASSRNKCFYGDPGEAENASPDEIEFYRFLTQELGSLLEAKKISESTFVESNYVIGSLEFLHRNNIKISQEFSESSFSPTYGNRIHIHTENKDLPFQRRAQNLFEILRSSYHFAVEHDLAADFFSQGLTRVNGCLEGRFSALDQWTEDRRRYFHSLISLSEEEKEKRLPDTARNIIYQVIAQDFDFYFTLADERPKRRELAQKIEKDFEGQIDLSGNPITYELAYQALKEVCLIDSSSPSPKRNSISQDYIQHVMGDESQEKVKNEIVFSGDEFESSLSFFLRNEINPQEKKD